MYRFLFTARWLGFLALAVTAAVVMVFLGNWQLSRYEERSAINNRIDAATGAVPVPLDRQVPAPTGTAGTAGAGPTEDAVWSRVTATGRYDTDNLILVRGRTVNGTVGFELVVPLLLDDGTAVLVDLGWIPPASGGDALAQPQVPPIAGGQVTANGRVHLTESRSGEVSRRNGKLETRRVDVARLAAELPYPVYGAYILLDEQIPAADPVFQAVQIRHENNWQNLGYVVQWWLFAAMTLFAYGWAARREAHGITGKKPEPLDRAAEPTPAHQQS
ncbi:SURF1 family cytochrome oxidase biogenesis protein [Melissospora conviva]|uniref:SURF1 family cytochrome oxidase biogenesis protein n=1 Tax=Melissospora conviva TaxID=3388432 RepID=UPI003C158BA5